MVIDPTHNYYVVLHMTGYSIDKNDKNNYIVVFIESVLD